MEYGNSKYRVSMEAMGKPGVRFRQTKVGEGVWDGKGREEPVSDLQGLCYLWL